MTELDDGETVIIAAGAHANGEKNYHTEPENCVVVQHWDPDRYRHVPVESLTNIWSECGHCAAADAVETGDPDTNRTTRTCPQCGVQTDNLGLHMRGCTGGRE